MITRYHFGMVKARSKNFLVPKYFILFDELFISMAVLALYDLFFHNLLAKLLAFSSVASRYLVDDVNDQCY